MADLNELDDFNEIEKQGKLKHELTLSNIYHVKVGGFGDINIVKTYIASLTVDELEQDVSVYETLSKDKTWPVSQIIQREVDRIRVSNISRDYVLRRERMVKYFPPLIVALLPKADNDEFALTLDYDKTEDPNIKEYIFEKSNYRTNDRLKDYFVKAPDLSLTKGLFLLEVSKVFDCTLLCWDKLKYYAVVIDGQHRLQSLIESKKQNAEIKNYYQDVVFVEFSQLIKRLDYKVTPVEIVRRVFVDINTNAKRVGVVRQILMDDKDLPSLIVQSLVDSVNKDGSDKEETKYLKSQLVDWYGDSLKHSLPHITGILALQQIISDYLLEGSMSSIDDLRSPNNVKRWVNTLNSAFLVDKKIQEKDEYSSIYPLLKSLQDYNEKRSLDEEIYEDEIEVKETTLFVYDYRTLEIAQKTFEELYASSVVRFFNSFEPYKQAYQIVHDNKGFEHGSTIYRALLSSRKKIIVTDSLKEALAKLKAELEGKLNDRFYLLFTVLGQKSLFNLLFKRIFYSFNLDYTEDIILNITEKFLKEVNTLVTIDTDRGFLFGRKEQFILDNLSNQLIDRGPIASHFWEGIIYENNRIIYNTQGIKSLSSTIEYLISLNDAINNDSELPSFDILYMKARVKRILKKTSDMNDSELEENALAIIQKKKEFIESVFTRAKK